MSEKRELRVFLASPGDVPEERDAVEGIASALNATLSDLLDVVIVVRRFEQLSAAAGRPQSRINNWVEDCDLLVAIVHRRWGSPSGDGFDSGFGEEFARAIRRYEQTGGPVVSLHFKDVDPISLDDPGPQLEKVLAFRKRIETDHAAFYRTFAQLGDFRADVTKLLVEEMHRVGRVGAAGTGYSPRRSGAEAEVEVRSHSANAGGTPARTELAQILAAFASAVDGEQANAPLDADRLQLFASALSRDDDLPGTHLTNRLFARRSTLAFSDWELRVWMDAYLADCGRASQQSERVVPFPSVIGRVELESAIDRNASELASSSISNIASGLLRHLTALRLRPSSLWEATDTDNPPWPEFRHLARQNSRDLIAYWSVMATPGDAAIASSLSSATDPQEAAAGRALEGLIAVSPSLNEVAAIDPALLIDPNVSERVSGSFAKLSTESLDELSRRPYLRSDIRLAAIRELCVRREVSSALIEYLFKEKSMFVEFDRDWQHTARELVLPVLNVDSFKTLIDVVSKVESTADRRHILARTARVNPELGNLVRDSLVPDPTADLPFYFELRSAPDAEAEKIAKSVLAKTYAPENDRQAQLSNSGAEQSTLDFVRGRDVVAALRYLVRSAEEQGHTPQSWLVREIRSATGLPGVSKYDVLALLEQVVRDEDIDLLVDQVRGLRTDRARISVALRVATLKHLRALIEDENPTIAICALTELGDRHRPPTRKTLIKALRSPDAELRMTALGLLVPMVEDLHVLLRSYTDGPGTHYYNVICEIDRLLAAIPPLWGRVALGDVTEAAR